MRRIPVYIYEDAAWPEFTWDAESLASLLAAVRHKQGRLLGKMQTLGFDLRTEASVAVLTSDVVKSSAIEGEKLDPDEVMQVELPTASPLVYRINADGSVAEKRDLAA